MKRPCRLNLPCEIEVRTGLHLQRRPIDAPIVHVGLGTASAAEVIRIEWPNGVPQTVYLPGTDETVVDREMLKGSCAFAYTWDGTRFRFVASPTIGTLNFQSYTADVRRNNHEAFVLLPPNVP